MKKAGVTKKAGKGVKAPVSKKDESTPSVPVRGGFRCTYHAGNVGWQKAIERLRLVVNVCEFATRIGSDDKVVSSLMGSVDAEEKKVCDEKVRIPSDVTTRIASLRVGVSEDTVGSKEYSMALRKLASLVRFVESEPVRTALTKEIAGAKAAQVSGK